MIVDIPEGCKIEVSYYISDFKTVDRTWKERLFSLPWNPLQKVKAVYSPTAYRIGNVVFVSPKTFVKLQKELEQNESRTH